MKPAQSRGSAFWLLVALIAAFTVHNLFDNKPLAFYIAQSLLVIYLMVREGLRSGARVAVVCIFGVFLAGTTAACGAAFPQLQDGTAYLCDLGTGAPLSPITFLVGVSALGWALGKEDG